MNYKPILRAVLAKLTEKTTWVGLAVLAASCGIAISPDNAALLGGIGTAIAGVLLVKLDDPKAPE